ncbi:unnamed protein product, partial [marine sediment metagenome]
WHSVVLSDSTTKMEVSQFATTGGMWGQISRACCPNSNF